MKAEEVKELIIKSFHEKKNSHAFLLVTNNIEKTLNDVKEIIKSINSCDDASKFENICNLIDKDNNPDVIIVKPDGKEIKTESIINIISSFTTKPLINKYSTYVISECDKMNTSSANKILKFLEEPEDNIIGFFITDKLSAILPTIKSRCEIYNYRFGNISLLDVLGITEEEYGLVFDKTMDLVSKLNGHPKYILMLESKKNSDLDREEVDLILNLIRKMYTIKYESIVSNKYLDLDFMKNILDVITTNDINIIVNRIRLLDNIISDFKFNLNKELMFNKLFLLWE